MNFKLFLSDKILTTILIVIMLLSAEVFLIPYNVSYVLKIYIPCSILTVYFIGLYIEYLKRKKYYRKIRQTVDCLEEKYLFTEITEFAEQGNFFDAEFIKNIFHTVNKSIIENINKYKTAQREYKEYIEMWVHDIKTPIAVGKMITENNKNPVTKSIEEELDKIDEYTEKVLYYARSNDAEKDYIIKSCILKDIITESIKQSKKYLIRKKFKIKLECDDCRVPCDKKWVIFILNQIISNSVKYCPENSELKFKTKIFNEKTVLIIKDNGPGIPADEIDRVFDKGFTGTNGRTLNQKSTGIGMYLCKKLCRKLNIGISIKSEKECGTSVSLIFPVGSHNLFNTTQPH